MCCFIKIPLKIAHICTVCNGQLLQLAHNKQYQHFWELGLRRYKHKTSTAPHLWILKVPGPYS